MSGVDYISYLESKKSIDDTSLNPVLFSKFTAALQKYQATGRIRILDAGAGTGAMCRRLLEHDVITDAEYILLDADAAFLSHARKTLPEHAQALGWRSTPPDEDTLEIRRKNGRVTLKFITGDILKIRDVFPRDSFHTVIAHAVLDILPLEDAAHTLISLIKPGGLYYFTLNYDGLTRFLPVVDLELDAGIEHRYNRTMDQHEPPTGGSRTGRRLIDLLTHGPTTPVGHGNSDWFLTPRASCYTGDEHTFLRAMLDTVHSSLKDSMDLDAWYHTRLGQLDQNELTFIGRHVDLLGLNE